MPAFAGMTSRENAPQRFAFSAVFATIVSTKLSLCKRRGPVLGDHQGRPDDLRIGT